MPMKLNRVHKKTSHDNPCQMKINAKHINDLVNLVPTLTLSELYPDGL